MCDSIKNVLWFIHAISWNYLAEVATWFTFSTWSLQLSFLYEYIIAYYWPYVSTCIWYPAYEQTWNVSPGERKTKTLETNESPGANARCSSLEFNTVMESKHTRRDLSVQPQGHSFQFRESPKRGFQNE